MKTKGGRRQVIESIMHINGILRFPKQMLPRLCSVLDGNNAVTDERNIIGYFYEIYRSSIARYDLEISR
jgi:hypothetical protein